MSAPAHILGRDAVKRAFDIAVAACALVLGAPVFLTVFLLVRARLGSPAIFIQDRPGKGGRIFRIYKFRTLTDARDQGGALLPDAARMTSFGRCLRATSLDELPELWNVLKGDMSLVGPRPLLVQYLPLYSPEQARRHEVRPGITGWAQINGRNATSWEERFRLDVWYVDNRSFKLDLKILLATFAKVARSEGIAAEGAATMPPFTGTGPR
ncbi:MAG TPA: sugar transferase [Hyphomicrobiales bacterium]|nr:sugar transferase [Hyphomicrobiales bacterium]